MEFEQLIIRNCCILLLTSRYTTPRHDEVVVKLVDSIINRCSYSINDYNNILHIIYWLSPANIDSERKLNIVREDIEVLKKYAGRI